MFSGAVVDTTSRVADSPVLQADMRNIVERLSTLEAATTTMKTAAQALKTQAHKT